MGGVWGVDVPRLAQLWGATMIDDLETQLEKALAVGVAKPRSGGGRPSAYQCKDGRKVIGTTTITGRFGDKQALIAWAFKRGKDGHELYDSRDAAAAVGTYCHALIDADIHGVPPPPRPSHMSAEDERQARQGWESFCVWRDQVRLVVVATEVPLVSEMHHYGGTIDCLARIGGKLMVLDFKSSNGTYPEHIVQVAAYRQLVRECMREEVHDACLLRVGKEYANFAYLNLPRDLLDEAWLFFHMSLTMYDIDAKLKSVCR